MLELSEQFAAVDWKDFDEVPQETFEFSEYSDFFTEAYHNSDPERLANEIHSFFRFVAHPYRRCFDSPAKSPRNEEVESAIRNKGTKGCCTFIRDTGKFILRRLDGWMFYGDNLLRKHYYTSDSSVAMPYFDVDCHKAYQTEADADAARSLIEKEMLARIGTAPLFLRSHRGRNGYVLVDVAREKPSEANEVFDELQDAIGLLFAKHNIMADFEIKGTITWRDRSGTLSAGRYGKLPMCADDWGYNWHRRLAASKRISLAELKNFVAQIKSEVTAEDIARHEAAQRQAFLDHYLPFGKQQRWKLVAEFGLGGLEDMLVKFEGQDWIPKNRIGDDLLDKLWPNYEPPVSTASCSAYAPHDDGVASPPHSDNVPKKEAQPDDDLAQEQDSFKRQRKALLKLARILKRVPTVDEALKYIRDHGLYSGAWANRARRPRVRGILKYIARTFDAAKCSKPGRTSYPINVTKYDVWAKTKFPHGLMERKQRNIVTDDFKVIELREQSQVSWEFISVFALVCDHCLLVNKNENGSLPHQRAKAFWNWLHNKGLVTVAFDDRKWAACRDRLEKLGIIKITDRRYEAGKAMRWAVDQFFPLLGLWKSKKSPSMLEAVDWREWTDSLVNTREREHNFLLRQQSNEGAFWGVIPDAQPPPGINSG